MYLIKHLKNVFYKKKQSTRNKLRVDYQTSIQLLCHFHTAIIYWSLIQERLFFLVSIFS